MQKPCFGYLNQSDQSVQVGIGCLAVTKSIADDFRRQWFQYIDHETKNDHVNGEKDQDQPNQVDFQAHQIHI